MPPAAKLHHICPRVTPPNASVPHISAGQLITVSRRVNVLINNLPAVISGDTCVCLEEPNSVSGGSSSVFINNQPAARLGDATTHGGTIDQGSSSVMIGG
jgi:uncharacterized Zn-binding protein involved in type VI secretion